MLRGFHGWFGVIPISGSYGGALTDAYILEIARSLYHSIDMGCLLLPMEFEMGSFILFSRNRAFLLKNLGFQNQGVFKKRSQLV